MKKCKICGVKFEPKYSSVQNVCSYKCAIDYSKQQKQKDWTKRKKVIKDSLKTKGLVLKEFVFMEVTPTKIQKDVY